MRVLVVPKWYPWPERPVFGIFCREHARALARRHEVLVMPSLATPSPPFALYERSEAVEDGLPTIRLRYRRPRLRPGAMGCQLAGMIAVLRELRRDGWRPDVIHAHVYSAGLPALVLGRLSRAPVVITEHYTGFQRGLITGADRFTAVTAFHHADLVAPVSEELAGEITRLAPGARLQVVDNTVDTELFHPPPWGERRAGSAVRAGSAGTASRAARLLTVASLAPKKGHVHLLQAVATLAPRHEVELTLVGEGKTRRELLRRAQELGIAGRVRFLGELPPPEVAELMRESDLFVLPSLFENQPVSMIEALASGLPVVATDVGGVAQLLRGRGRLCRAGDADALASAIEAALTEDADGAGASDERARYAHERFGFDTVAARWTEIYDSLLSNRGNTSSATVAATASGR